MPRAKLAKTLGPLAALDAIRDEVFGKADAPEHSFTTAEYAQRYGVPPNTAHGQLKRLVAAGRLKSGCRIATRTDGKRIRATAYWVPDDSLDRLSR